MDALILSKLRRLRGLIVFCLCIPITVMAAQTLPASDTRFPDFGYMIDTDHYNGRLFRLSQDYPSTLAKKDLALSGILSINFKQDWKDYALKIRHYILAGNIPPEVSSDADAFFFEDNKTRKWFHPPWLHWGADGSEGFHGLQRDAKIIPHLLSAKQKTPGRIYSVSFYNERAAYVLDKVWPKKQEGFDLSYFKKGKTFPDGSMMVALAFTTAKTSEVGFLQKGIQWKGYVLCEDVPGCNIKKSPKRIVAPLHLIQMDVMIKDKRAKETGGWVFMAFLYNNKANQNNKWFNLTPMGLSWGNDPTVTKSLYHTALTQSPVNHQLTATKINDSRELPPMRLGFGGRFNGLFNGSKNAHLVSCGSCHTATQFPTLSSFSPKTNDPIIQTPGLGSSASTVWMHWFQDLKEHETLDSGTINTDKSMLILKGIYGYLDFKAKEEEGKLALVEMSKIFKHLS